MTDTLVLIDGHALVFRAFYGVPNLTSPKGELVNAVHGFTSTRVGAPTDRVTPASRGRVCRSRRQSAAAAACSPRAAASRASPATASA